MAIGNLGNKDVTREFELFSLVSLEYIKDTVQGGQVKLHRGRDCSLLIPLAAPHSTIKSPTLDRFDLGEEKVPNVASENNSAASTMD